jgi:hypothetical protein
MSECAVPLVESALDFGRLAHVDLVGLDHLVHLIGDKLERHERDAGNAAEQVFRAAWRPGRFWVWLRRPEAGYRIERVRLSRIMDRLFDSPPRQQAPRPPREARPSAWADGLAAARAELSQRARQDGYVDSWQWAVVRRRLTTHGVPQAALDELRAELARRSAEQEWVFPEELPPAEWTRRREVLVAKARCQARRVPVITAGYLSALLALGRAWDLAHDQLAQELARSSVAERWPVDWELACGMEGLLGAEQARQRVASAREQAVAEFARRGQKGWLGEADQVDLYAGLRRRGLSAAEARALLVDLHSVADAKRWVCWAGWPAAPPTDTRLELLVDKVAQQAGRAGRVGEGFRQALLGEAAATGVDQARLLSAITKRREREQWSAAFSRGWRLPRVGRLPGWRRPGLEAWRRAVSSGPCLALAPHVRPLAPSVLRQAPLLVVLLAALSGNRPVAPPGPVASPVVAAPAPTTTPVVLRRATPEPTPASVHLLLVAHTDGLGARLRTAPATGPVARLLGEGTAVVVIGADVQVDGTAWKRVQAPDGTSGWIAADLLQPAEPDRAARPESAQGLWRAG